MCCPTAAGSGAKVWEKMRTARLFMDGATEKEGLVGDGGARRFTLIAGSLGEPNFTWYSTTGKFQGFLERIAPQQYTLFARIRLFL
jgi:hypothetical protein